VGGYPAEAVVRNVMAFFRNYQCPECNGVFRFLHHPSDAPPPDRCQLCAAWMLDTPEPVFVPQAPGIGTLQAKSHDDVYRAMEDASEARTHLMAQYGGGSASDYNHTKITDMHDNTREGDISAKYAPPPNYVQEFMKLNQSQGPSIGGGFAPMSGATGAEWAAAAHTGTFPHQGAATLASISPNHAQLARIMEAGGRLNRDG